MTSARTALFRSHAFLGHDTGSHPEHPRRMPAIDAELARAGLDRDRPEIEWRAAEMDLLGRVHEPRYLDALTTIADGGGGWIDRDTYCGPDSLDVARLAAGAAVAAVEAALSGVARRCFVLGRPPGHHAVRARGMGFCLLNSIAVAARHALDRGLERVAIVDWDVHHGNGTQDIFYAEKRVLFCSIHQYGGHFYPGTGRAEERGAGPGHGLTINVPLSAGQGDSEYLASFDGLLAQPLRAFRPELLLVSAGFDAHVADPIGGMRLTELGFATLTDRVCAISEASDDVPVVAVLEGGYDPEALGRSVVSTLRILDGERPGMYDAPDAARENVPVDEETDSTP